VKTTIRKPGPLDGLKRAIDRLRPARVVNSLTPTEHMNPRHGDTEDQSGASQAGHELAPLTVQDRRDLAYTLDTLTDRVGRTGEDFDKLKSETFDRLDGVEHDVKQGRLDAARGDQDLLDQIRTLEYDVGRANERSQEGVTARAKQGVTLIVLTVWAIGSSLAVCGLGLLVAVLWWEPTLTAWLSWLLNFWRTG
jgi:hypothetical protein